FALALHPLAHGRLLLTPRGGALVRRPELRRCDRRGHKPSCAVERDDGDEQLCPSLVNADPGAQSSRCSSFIGAPINPAVAVEQIGHPSGFVILAVAASAATGLLWADNRDQTWQVS